MPIYKCNLCSKEFNKKNHLDNHLTKKKKSCIDEKVIEKHNDNNFPEKTLRNPENFFIFPEKTLRNPEELKSIPDDKVICDFCDKMFTRKDNLKIHIEKYCKNKKKNDDNAIIIKKMSEEIELLKSIISKISTENSNNTTNTNSNNTMNNSNNKTTNNNINQNIQVNISGFGKEDLEKLDIKEAMNVYLKSTGGNIVPNMLNYINLNKNYPENHNICITDMSREIVKIHNGTKYIYKKFKNAKFDIVDKIVDNINGIVTIYRKGDYKKSADINKKININDTSLKLISGEELVESENESDDEKSKEDLKSTNSEDIIKDLNNMDKNVQKMISNNKKIKEKEIHKINIDQLNSKMEGLQKLTFDKLKDELYNNRELMEPVS